MQNGSGAGKVLQGANNITIATIGLQEYQMMRDKRSPDQLETLWKEKDMVDGEVADALVMIMRTNGCVWAKTGGCTMCGYRSASLKDVTSEDLLKQLDQAISRYDGEPFVKIYTSGSFLDEKEIPEEVRNKIFDAFSDCRRILFESRPEFITSDVISTVPSSVTVSLGLESCNEEILRTSVNKGFTPDEIRAAGYIAKDAGLAVRTYLLLKPLYLQEAAAIRSAVESVHYADPFSDEISINPVNVQKGTLVERIWKKGDYRPPWIWSLVEVLKQTAGTVDSRLMSSPSGGGTQRGVHNCGDCDKRVLEAIERFSFTQNVNDLAVTCDCIDRWRNYMKSETILGTAADLDRGFDEDLMIRK